MKPLNLTIAFLAAIRPKRLRRLCVLGYSSSRIGDPSGKWRATVGIRVGWPARSVRRGLTSLGDLGCEYDCVLESDKGYLGLRE